MTAMSLIAVGSVFAQAPANNLNNGSQPAVAAKQVSGMVSSINCGGAQIFSGPVIVAQEPILDSDPSYLLLPYSGGDGGYITASSVNSTGVTGLVLHIPVAQVTGNGTLDPHPYITGTPLTASPSDFGTAYFSVSFGGQSCTMAVPVFPSM